MVSLFLDTVSSKPMLALDSPTGRTSFVAPGRRGSGALLGFLEKTLHQQGLRPDQIKTVIFNRGPGSFTGIKLGVVIARTLGLDPQVQVFAFTSFDLMALASGGKMEASLVIDAYQGDVFHGTYFLGELTYSLRPASEIQDNAPVYYYGRETEALPGWRVISRFEPSLLFQLEQEGLIREDLRPLYLKKSAAEVNRECRKSLGGHECP